MHRNSQRLLALVFLCSTACGKGDNYVGSIASDAADTRAFTGDTGGAGGGTRGPGGAGGSMGGAGGSAGGAGGFVGASGGFAGGTSGPAGGTGGSAGGSRDAAPDAVPDTSAADLPSKLDGLIPDLLDVVDAPSFVQHPYVAPEGLSCLSYPSNGTYRVYPYDPAFGAGQVWPSCTLACDAVEVASGAGVAPLDQALPGGWCDDEGATCDSVLAGWCPPCADVGGPRNRYTCTCRGHAWQCAVVTQGSSMCNPPSCLDPSLTQPVPASCSQLTWGTTQVCGCGRCRDMCAQDSDCPSGRCHVPEICYWEPCSGPNECVVLCYGLCEPATDGGPTLDSE